MLQVEIIIGVSLLILCTVWKDYFGGVLRRKPHAVSTISSLSPLKLKILFFTLLSACTVAALQTVGAILVIAMVITPGATAYLLTDRFSRLVIIAIIIGSLTSGVGALRVSSSSTVLPGA
ncbi:metal ABC transporter permease [Serratia marcescens]|uniref:Metal ABC transporter permease n=1 Tax=Serratia marcescens TaxID=615 RepID=A0A939SNN1_SERMA|nr:metal ABC transporter permease [Serratia marcescens]